MSDIIASVMAGPTTVPAMLAAEVLRKAAKPPANPSRLRSTAMAASSARSPPATFPAPASCFWWASLKQTKDVLPA